MVPPLTALQVGFDGDLGSNPGAFAALVDGSLDMVQVGGVLEPGVVAAILQGLPGDGNEVHPPGRADEAVRVFGVMIAPTGVHPRGPPLAHYRQGNAALEEALGTVFQSARTRVLRVLSELGGAPAEIPEGYSFGSVRRMPEGCGAPLHRDAYPHTDAYLELRLWCDLAIQISWYVQLSVPEDGGALEVYPTLGDSDVPRGGGGEVDYGQLASAEVHGYRPEVGDMLIHAGSARWHRITPVVGPRARHTLGGFCAWSADHSSILAWG